MMIWYGRICFPGGGGVLTLTCGLDCLFQWSCGLLLSWLWDRLMGFTDIYPLLRSHWGKMVCISSDCCKCELASLGVRMSDKTDSIFCKWSRC